MYAFIFITKISVTSNIQGKKKHKIKSWFFKGHKNS